MRPVLFLPAVCVAHRYLKCASGLAVPRCCVNGRQARIQQAMASGRARDLVFIITDCLANGKPVKAEHLASLKVSEVRWASSHACISVVHMMATHAQGIAVCALRSAIPPSGPCVLPEIIQRWACMQPRREGLAHAMHMHKYIGP